MISSAEDQAIKDGAVRYQKKWYPYAKMMWVEVERAKKKRPLTRVKALALVLG